MPRQSYTRLGRRPLHAEPLLLQVVDRKRVSPGFVRITLGGADAERFVPMGFDQWARLFIGASSREQVPHPLTPRSYLRHLTMPGERPLMRSYTVAGHRPGEIDIELVLHDGGVAPAWALSCRTGDPVALLDQGIGFVAPAGAPICLVGDASALPAVAGILRSLPPEATGRAVLELSEEDRRELERPPGVELHYAEAGSVEPDPHMFGWVAGESALVAAVRRRWLAAGVPKDRIAFCGYWRR